MSYKVGDKFELKKTTTFTRSFPRGGRNNDGSLSDFDKTTVNAGSIFTCYEIHTGGPDNLLHLRFSDDVAVPIREGKLLGVFEPL
jgi:hypothetical protein